jgi:hypothetical protein
MPDTRRSRKNWGVMLEERRPIPGPHQLRTALKALIEPRFAEPVYLEEDELEAVQDVLTLECVGGPTMPTMPERERRFQEVRELLQSLCKRFEKLPLAELKHLPYPRNEPDGEERYARELKRLPLGAQTLFQLNTPNADPDIRISIIQSAGNAIWGKGEYPESRWFERKRQKFLLSKLADWVIEVEKAHREANSQPDNGVELSPSSAQPTSPPADTPVLDEPESLEGRGDEIKAEHSGDGLIDQGDEAVALLPPAVASGRNLRVGRLAAFAFVAALAVGALAVAFVVLDSDGGTPANPAGEVGRILNVSAPEDLAVAGGYVWLVDANSQTAIRISETDGRRETIFVDQPPFVSEPLPDTNTGIRIGGYQVAAGLDRAWIVTNGGTVLSIGATGRKVEILNPDINVLNGDPALYRGSLWIVGFGENLYRLRADSGAVQRQYVLRGRPFSIDKLVAGVGSVWAYTEDSGGDSPRIYKLTPVAGKAGVEEHILSLDQPVSDLAAGLGGVWTVESDGAVTWHDPATGGSARPVQVPGGAEEVAVSREAVWVTTGADAVVRIDPITLAVVGEPIPLPENPYEIAADKNIWVATDRKLVEIES